MTRTSKIFAAGVLALFSCTSYGEETARIPAFADISVNGIYLDDPVSFEAVLKRPVRLLDSRDSLPHANFLSARKSQLLVVTVHPGGDMAAGQFRIQFAKGPRRNTKVLNAIPEFATGKKLHLGMQRIALIKILGPAMSIDTSGPEVILKYELEESSDEMHPNFLSDYHMPYYYGEYHFRHGQLIEMDFGFTYP